MAWVVKYYLKFGKSIILIGMSKIGKKPITIPDGVTVDLANGAVTVKGSNGELKRMLPACFELTRNGNVIEITPLTKSAKSTVALWGTYRQHLSNMIEGVTRGFVKVLEFEGIGYRAEVVDSEIVLRLGFTHPIRMTIPGGLKVATTKNTITIGGANKEEVGEFAAKIRRLRRPEPYKGTGIRYQGEVIRRKAGKKLAGAAG